MNKDGLEVNTRDTILTLPADTIIVCAGQISKNSLSKELKEQGIRHHIIGGAFLAKELDAKRSIDEGARLGNGL